MCGCVWVCVGVCGCGWVGGCVGGCVCVGVCVCVCVCVCTVQLGGLVCVSVSSYGLCTISMIRCSHLDWFSDHGGCHAGFENRGRRLDDSKRHGH